MRMWMVSPPLMCTKHLLGEHGELHKFLHNWTKHHRVDGRIAGNAMEPMAYKTRHDALAAEMLARGFNHGSPLEQPDFDYLPPHHREYVVDALANQHLLQARCPACAERMYNQLEP